MDEPGRGFGAARFIFLYKKSNRKPFDQCSGHPVFAHRPVKTVCLFAKVSDSVGRAEMPRLAAAAVDEIAGGQISTLRIVAQYTAAVSRIEIGIQKNYRN